MVRLSVAVDLALFVTLLVLVAIAAGLVGSLTGLGGGVVVIPLLLILFGTSVPIAIGTGFVTILATSSATGAAYVRDRLSDLRIGMFLEIATVPGALIGATATVFLAHADLQSALLVALGVVFLAIIPGSLARRHIDVPDPLPQDARSRRSGWRGYITTKNSTGMSVPGRPDVPRAGSDVRCGHRLGDVRNRRRCSRSSPSNGASTFR